jgi:hypothetical protein
MNVVATIAILSLFQLLILLLIWRQLVLTAQDIKDAQAILTTAIAACAQRVSDQGMSQDKIQEIIDTTHAQTASVDAIAPTP